jgi:hypothetical protein
MAELKAYRIKGITLGDARDVYIKSDADKVIALLTDKANYNEYAYKLKSEELADTCRFYEDELRHHKYKRCLAVARWCRRNRLHSSVCGPVEKIDFWEKWRKRWLELAEKFKEAKFPK